ncbi:MAG: hypothetical protein QME46_05530 [Thermoanaerobacteraceae bacterium]|nr:hypothetical protein [Thermoanaerobacteraceae bacterium]
MNKKFVDMLVVLLITAVITLVGNFIGYKINPIAAIPGMLILIGIVVVGILLAEIIPVKLPSIVYISLIGIIITIPGFPGAAFFTAMVSQVQFLSLTTPVLAYAGISIGKDLDAFREVGWKIIVVSMFVFVGTFVGSAIIAQVVLKLIGQI